MINNLVPCPYCGNRSVVLYTDSNGVFRVKCGRYHCDKKFEVKSTEKEICIKAWNENAETVKKAHE